MRSRGFTLIELLVVTAIIAILAGAIRPSIPAANDRANLAICLGRLEQIGLAIRQFVEDHGRMPAQLEDLVRERYLLHQSILHCSKTGNVFDYHPCSPDAPGTPVIAGCVPLSTARGRRPHGQGNTCALLRLNGTASIIR